MASKLSTGKEAPDRAKKPALTGFGGSDSDQGTDHEKQGDLPFPPPSKSQWKIDLLIQESKLMCRFGGYMGDPEFTEHLNKLVSRENDGVSGSKHLSHSRIKTPGKEFSKSWVNATVLKLIKMRYEGLPEQAAEFSKVKRPQEREFTAAEGDRMAMSGVISAQTKANRKTLEKNHSEDNIEGQAVGGSLRRQAHAGPPTQTGKRYEPYPQRTGIRLGLSRAHAERGAAAVISGVATGMSKLNPYQTPEAPQRNATAQARLPAAQSHKGPLHQGRESQQHYTPTRQAELGAKGIPAPFNPLPTSTNPQAPRFTMYPFLPPLPATIPAPAPQPFQRTMQQPHTPAQRIPISSLLEGSSEDMLPPIQQQGQQYPNQPNAPLPYEPAIIESDPNPITKDGKFHSIMKHKR